MADTDLRDDETLTAFLDGELTPADQRAVALRLAGDAALSARLGRLERAGEGIDAAFDAAFDAAPIASLDAMLQQALAQVPPPRLPAPSLVRRVAYGWNPRALAASLLVALALAGGLGFGLGAAFMESAPKPAESWHQAVAEYWSLTTAATLTLEPTAELGARQLALAGAALGLPLTPQGIAVDGASFRGAQLYDFGGKPLVQIAFLDPDYGPIAYCVIRNGETEGAAQEATEIDGFGVVRWSGEGFGRMVIGRAPPERLRAIAATLAIRSGQGT